MKNEKFWRKKERYPNKYCRRRNVLGKKGDMICENNILPPIGYIMKKKFEIIGISLGIKRRSVSLDIKTGHVLYMVGDSVEKVPGDIDLSIYVGANK